MANPRVYHLVCDVCKKEFQAPLRRKKCSADCRERERAEQWAATLERRRLHVKECPECHRVFSREETLEGEGQFELRVCCSNKCSRKHHKKETTARNSIDYHGVRLSIEDVCKLEQKGYQTIRLLMKKDVLPGAKWAEPELRARRVRPPPSFVEMEEVIKVRTTEEHKEAVEAYAQWRGIKVADLLKMLVNEEMARNPKR